MREVSVATPAVLDGGTGFAGIVGLGDEVFAAADTTGRLDDLGPSFQPSSVVEELHV